MFCNDAAAPPAQVLVKLFLAQLLAVSWQLREAAEALSECSLLLGSAPGSRYGQLGLPQMRLHCALLQLLVNLAAGSLAALQMPGVHARAMITVRRSVASCLRGGKWRTCMLHLQCLGGARWFRAVPKTFSVSVVAEACGCAICRPGGEPGGVQAGAGAGGADGRCRRRALGLCLDE